MAICIEPTCGLPYKPAKHWQRFCCKTCRITFEIRKTQRGALAYEHLMSWRYDRKRSGGASIVTLSQLTRDWHEADEKMRTAAREARAAT